MFHTEKRSRNTLIIIIIIIIVIIIMFTVQTKIYLVDELLFSITST